MEMQIFKWWENGQSMNREKSVSSVRVCVGGGGLVKYIMYIFIM